MRLTHTHTLYHCTLRITSPRIHIHEQCGLLLAYQRDAAIDRMLAGFIPAMFLLSGVQPNQDLCWTHWKSELELSFVITWSDVIEGRDLRDSDNYV